MNDKTCTHCKIRKTLVDFPKCSRQKSGLDPWCKSCRAVQSKRHYEKNKESYTVRMKQYRIDHPEKYPSKRMSDEEWARRKAASKLRHPENIRKWRAANAERIAASKAKRQTKHRHLMQSDPEYRATHLTRERAKAAKHRKLIREAKAIQRAEREAAELQQDIQRIKNEGVQIRPRKRKICPLLIPFPDLYKAAKNERISRTGMGYASRLRRKMRVAQVVDTLTNAEWEGIKLRFKYRCAYCGERRTLTRDHVIPIHKKRGPNSVENIVPACTPCNSRKRDRPAPMPVQTLMFA